MRAVFARVPKIRSSQPLDPPPQKYSTYITISSKEGHPSTQSSRNRGLRKPWHQPKMHRVMRPVYGYDGYDNRKKKRSETLLASCKASQSSRYLQLSFGEDLGLPIATMNSAQRGQVTEDPKCLFEGHDGQAT